MWGARASTARAANARHEGTVVRWSAGFALGEILVIGSTQNATLIPAVTAIAQCEQDNAIRRLYVCALKKLGAPSVGTPRSPSRTRRSR